MQLAQEWADQKRTNDVDDRSEHLGTGILPGTSSGGITLAGTFDSSTRPDDRHTVHLFT
jgi:hypothetical protein